ncbi:hypothetical protein BDAP_002815 [Binucleata daphniae]
MACHLHGLYIFEKALLQQKIAFAIADIIICDVNQPIPTNYYHMTDQNDQICVVDYVEIKNYKKLGKAYILYTTTGPSKIFSLVEVFDSVGTFITVNNKHYKIFANPYKYYFTSVNFDKKQFVYKKTETRNGLVCEESTSYELKEYYGIKENSKELIKSYINANNNVYFQKTLSFVYSTKESNRLYGHCIYRIDNDHITCYVLLVEKYRNIFFYWNLLISKKPETLVNKLCNVDLNIVNEVNIMDNSKEYKKTYEFTKQEIETKILSDITQDKAITDEECKNENETHQRYNFTIPERNLYNYNNNRPTKFYINALTCILLEKKCVFLSKMPNIIFDFIKVCLELIKPLKWSYFLFCPLPSTLYSLLDSPFPFIIGIKGNYEEIKKYVKRNKITVFDLDTNIIICNKSKRKLPFYTNLISKACESNMFTSFNDYISALTNIIDTAREKTIQKNVDTLQDVLNNPKCILNEINETYSVFFSKFFETRIFVNYITTIPKVNNKYSMVFYNNTASLLLDATNSTYFVKEEVYNMFFDLMFVENKDKSNMKDNKIYKNIDREMVNETAEQTDLYTIDDLVLFDYFDTQDISTVLKYYLKYYCVQKEYKKLTTLIDKITNNGLYLNSQAYKYINCYTESVNLQFFYFYDLSEYNICIETESHTNTSSLQIHVYKNNASFYKCHILQINDLILLTKYLNIQDRRKQSLLITQPEIFWNIIIRLDHFNLPINILPKIEHNNLDLVLSTNEINSNCEPNKHVQ